MTWTVPKEWKGDRCFILAGGESIKEQEQLIPKLQGRVIAIKQSVALRPDADVMFIAGKDDPVVCAKFFPMHTGKYLIGRSTYAGAPQHCKFLQRDMFNIGRLSYRPTHLCGYDAGTSAINLAFLFGAKQIVLLGYDMSGGRWFSGRFKHHLPKPPQKHFDIHMSVLPSLASDLLQAGIEVVNCSMNSKVKVFKKQPLESFL